MEEVDRILKDIFQAIDLGLSFDLELALDEFPIELLDKKADKGYFNCFMNRCMSSPEAIQASRIVIQRWIKSDIDEYLPSSPIYFLMENDIDQNVIDMMIQSLYDWDYVDYVYQLIHQDSSPKTELALKRLDRAFGDQDQEVYQVLLKQIDIQREEEGIYNNVVKEFLSEKLEDVSEYAPRPKWIKSYYDKIPDEEDIELDIPEDLTIEGVLPSADRAADLILEHFDSLPVPSQAIQSVTTTFKEKADEKTKVKITEIPTIKSTKDKKIVKENVISCPMISTEERAALAEKKTDVRKAFLISYNAATVREKINLLGSLLTNKISEELLEKDEKLFTILGPSNSIYGMVMDPDNICCKYGGCRMLTCIDFENEDEFGEIVDEDPEAVIEWFKGACEYCHKKIAKKIYALRRPLTFGGWKGTFCSFECLRKVVPMNDVLNHFIINQIESQLMHIGIQDRIVSGEGEINNEELDELIKAAEERKMKGKYTKVTIQSIPKNITDKYSI